MMKKDLQTLVFSRGIHLTSAKHKRGQGMKSLAGSKGRALGRFLGQSPKPAEQKTTYLSKFPVAMRPGGTPLPIPNRTVKTRTAYDTWLVTARESEWLPELF